MAKDKVTWKELVEIEPQLLFLAEEALAYKKSSRGKKYVCANDRWYGYGQWKDRGLRDGVISLVGWCRRDHPNPILKSSVAYDVAYQHIYHLLPDCRNCSCIGYCEY